MSKKIKLIVCDVDGTLLEKGEDTLPKRTCRAIDALVMKGYAFAAASGRSYRELKNIFGGVCCEIYSICFDGALVMKGGHALYSAPVDAELLRKIPSADMVLLKEGGEIYKLVFGSGSTRARTYIENNRLLKRVYGGDVVEYAANDTDKSNAVNFLQQALGISRAETAAFGDNYNDIGMLKCAAYSYATPGAKADIKILARYNTNDVTGELEKIALKEDMS